mmetsp:Transcript_2519/g.9052  ORF Transcript_2519/g.9052 Transcript_2519/m.9052 type:complete len:200 (-) Transcript_2519:667-1266(-)
MPLAMRVRRMIPPFHNEKRLNSMASPFFRNKPFDTLMRGLCDLNKGSYIVTKCLPQYSISGPFPVIELNSKENAVVMDVVPILHAPIQGVPGGTISNPILELGTSSHRRIVRGIHSCQMDHDIVIRGYVGSPTPRLAARRQPIPSVIGNQSSFMEAHTHLTRILLGQVHHSTCFWLASIDVMVLANVLIRKVPVQVLSV